MDKVSVVLRVFFEDPFWIGILERVESGRMTVCKITFGPEPKDCEVHGFLAKEYYGLRFSPAVAAAVSEHLKNPKRVKRQVREELRESGMGTKSQQTGRKAVSREKKEAEARRQFELKQQKKKEKHRGR